MLRKVEKLSWIHMRVRELSRGQTDTQTHMQTVDTRGDDNIRSVSVQRRRFKKHRTANERSTVHTANKVEFDSLSRSTLSPKLNMFNSVDFVESQCFLSNVFFCPNVARLCRIRQNRPCRIRLRRQCVRGLTVLKSQLETLFLLDQIVQQN